MVLKLILTLNGAGNANNKIKLVVELLEHSVSTLATISNI